MNMENEPNRSEKWREPRYWYRMGLRNTAGLKREFEEDHPIKATAKENVITKFLHVVSTWLGQLGRGWRTR